MGIIERIDFKVSEEEKNDVVRRTYKYALRILCLVQELTKLITQNSKFITQHS
jgi:hypothetical protein